MAGQRLAAVVGDHLAEGAGEVHRGAAFSAVELDVSAVQVSHDPFGIEKVLEPTQVSLACGPVCS